ncbi:MAG: F0F1 ATP synthase subunit epsilon [Fimbriimonadaceae bacterium]|nr:F0F1 ATP synthase subunit epsilon [Chthonomonadaceae bacterium]MCO5298238.1 F0F1 ATP synthase subunit epsilon [Fimbriimonadaceae bacterium]
MANAFTLSIVAPDRSVVETDVTTLIAPGAQGYFGVLHGHLPMVAALKAGLIEYEDMQGQRHTVAVSGGFAEVTGAKVTILADAAERASEIDLARAEHALEEARKALRGESSGTTSREARQELERAMNRIRAAKGG